MRPRSVLAAGAIPLVLLAAACGSSGSTASRSTTATVGAVSSGTATAAPSGGTAVNPNAPEVVEPGDIPDNQVFVPISPPGGAFSVKVPEGWPRVDTGTTVAFTDKYNSITVATAPATAAPTVASITSGGLVDVASDPTFHLLKVEPVTRKAGAGILATYEIGSPPNPVTGKTALLAVERYVFFAKGTQAVLTLSGAKGADNVDPWKTVTDSLAWN